MKIQAKKNSHEICNSKSVTTKLKRNITAVSNKDVKKTFNRLSKLRSSKEQDELFSINKSKYTNAQSGGTLPSPHKRYNTRRKNPLNNSLAKETSPLASTIKATNESKNDRNELSQPVRIRNKKYDPSKHYAAKENCNSLMRKIKETPKHMIDYKHNLETSMFKKKLGLEKINDFQLSLHLANVDNKNTTLPKLREKSFEAKDKHPPKVYNRERLDGIPELDSYPQNDKDDVYNTPQVKRKLRSFTQNRAISK